MAARMSMQEAMKLVMEDIKKMTPAELRAELDRHRDDPFVQTMRELREFAASPEFAAIMEKYEAEHPGLGLPDSERVIYVLAPTPYDARDVFLQVRYADGRKRTERHASTQGARAAAWRLASQHNLPALPSQYAVTIEWGTK